MKKVILGALVLGGAAFGVMQSSTKAAPKSISDLNATALSVAYGETHDQACETWTGQTCVYRHNGVEHKSTNDRNRSH